MDLHTFKDSAGRVLAAFRGFTDGKGLGLKEIAEWRAELDKMEADLIAEIERRKRGYLNVFLIASVTTPYMQYRNKIMDG